MAARRMHTFALVAALVVALPMLVAAGSPDHELPSEESEAETGPTHYVQVSDGTWIALHVQMPENYVEGRRYPTILEASGYESGSADGRTPAGDLADQTGIEQLPLQGGTRAAHGGFHDDQYVTVMMSIRGTGCSSGQFDLFSWRSALDGREIIDGWIVEQPWSDGVVGIFGHSYSGITGSMIAATQPEHLEAISVSGLIGDLYRDITYPGGLTNYGFPLLWTGAIRPAYDIGGGVGGGMYPNPQQRCARNQTEKSREILGDPLIHGSDDTDNEWFRSRSLYPVLDDIRVPVHITTAYQDEQTGPRGATNVWTHLPDDISKRIVLVNGDHGTQDDLNVRADGLAWLDYWLRDARKPDVQSQLAFDADTNLTGVFGPKRVATTSSRVFLGYRDGDHRESGRYDGQIHSDGFPLGETAWTDLFLSADGTLVEDLADVQAGSAQWLHGTKRQSYSYQAGKDSGGEFSSSSGPDQIDFVYTAADDVVLAGPITATLHVAASAPDTELFVQLLDRAPSGELLHLQRGMLRASHRAHDTDPDGLSQWTADGKRIWRPWRAHEQRQPVTPGDVVEYLVEIFPVGHVLPAGHELVVRISAPPADDNDWMYVPKTAPGVNTIHLGPDTPSSIMLPVVPLAAVDGFDLLRDEVCHYEEMRCVTPAS